MSGFDDALASKLATSDRLRASQGAFDVNWDVMMSGSVGGGAANGAANASAFFDVREWRCVCF